MSAQPVAPHCGHRFKVIYLRGNPQQRAEVAQELRLTYNGERFVSEPYEIEPGQSAVALCALCKAPGTSLT
jgi:hypothetical protein